MALKDITLGQYFPGNSLLHRFDPRSKILFTVLFIAAIFLCKGLVSYGITLLILIAFTALLNLFYTDGTVLVRFWIFKITREGVRNACFLVLRIVMLVAGTFLLLSLIHI